MLHPFRSLPVVRDVRRAEAAPPAYVRDSITLGWEERSRARGRRRSDAGVEFGSALERGTVVRGGDCFVIEELATAVVVVERPEPVFVIRPQAPGEWALYAYQIGNAHLPIMIGMGEIVCADVPGASDVLTHYRIPFERDVRPFTPIGTDVSPHPHRP